MLSFRGTARYIASPELQLAVQAALRLERPLLVKGEPGTGKTRLAEEVAAALGRPLLQWHVKSSSKAQQGLYEYDAVARLRDAQLPDPEAQARVRELQHYLVPGVLWEAFTAEGPAVVLIDEIDKADLEFPNDLLRELDRMEFQVPELRRTIRARHRPLFIITSNDEKELPDAFLRRCFFHPLRFPDPAMLKAIVELHHPGLQPALLERALRRFLQLREVQGLKKKPSTSELIDWIAVLLAEGVGPEALGEEAELSALPPAAGALLKHEQDLHRVERLAEMQRRHR